MKSVSIWGLLISLLIGPIQGTAQNGLSLQQFLSLVKEKHRGLAALEIREDAALDKRTAGDTELIPTFSLSSKYLSDKSQPNALGGTETTSYINTASLSKHFTSGTTLGLNMQANEYKYDGIATGSARQQYAVGALGVSFTQSLWKDFFGAGTTLRQTRENATYELERETARLNIENLMVDAESAFWDYLLLQRTLASQKDSQQRADRIEKWVARRLSDGIGDRADLMNARALLATRQLQLAATQDNLVIAEEAVRNFLELGANEPTPVLIGDLIAKRPLDIYLAGDKGGVLRRDSYLKVLQARLQGAVADEVKDGLKPDLQLNGYYNLTNYTPYNGKLKDTTSGYTSDFGQTSLGVSFVYLFDTSVKQATLSNAQKQALAARLDKERALIESQSSWSEMIRRYDEFSKRVTISDSINNFQKERSKAQQDKLAKGRAITSDVITAEEDAATAELNFLQLNGEQRKMEARSRLFIKTQEKL